MATLVFTALGTLVGGPLGGAIGAMIGKQVDRAIIGSPKREGPRLQDLAVTTSSYGSVIPRHFGTMRAAGSIIWATDLMETTATSGGGKGKPSVTQYNYSVSFAVALASRPIRALGRIWADGNLLRGASGDLKTGGQLRVYNGHGDQPVDPLIASDKGSSAPAFRGTAYCVFDSLQVGEFGNRIPALTFEIIADDGAVTLQSLVDPVATSVAVHRSLDALSGYSDAGGPLSASLANINEVYPIGCDCSGSGMELFASDTMPQGQVVTLPLPAVDASEDAFGGSAGQSRRRIGDQAIVPAGLRYYDPDRDYQAGLQRAEGRGRPGREDIIEFPGALAAGDARGLANAAAERANWSRDLVSWRLAELDPALRPGTVVNLPGKQGRWRILSWEWRTTGVELELKRLPFAGMRNRPADSGVASQAADKEVTPTILRAFDLPADADGNPDARRVMAAVSSTTSGWKGASLHAVSGDGTLTPLGVSGAVRAAIGQTLTALPSSPALILEAQSWLDVQLAGDMAGPLSASADALANGANKALVGHELIQFARADLIGEFRWRLTGLLRGRGGTEHLARMGTPGGADFVLVDDRLVQLDLARVADAASLAAIGLADAQPVVAPIGNPRLGLIPLCPVHPGAAKQIDGTMVLSWCRRSRGSWKWQDQIDVPLNEQAQEFLVGIGNAELPAIHWRTMETSLHIDAANWVQIVTAHSNAPIWVKQVGTNAASLPLQLLTVS